MNKAIRTTSCHRFLRIRIYPVFVLAVPAALMSHQAAAHHSRSHFSDEKITIEGTIESYDWKNPHVYFTVRVADVQNDSRTWTIETHNTLNLSRHGWTGESLKPGDTVIVNGSPDRNPDRLYIFGDWMINTVSGERLTINGPPPEEVPEEPVRYSMRYVDGNPDLRGVWRIFPPEGGPSFGNRDVAANLPLTEKGQAAAAAFDRNAISARECIRTPLPAFSFISLFEVDRQDAEALNMRHEYDNIRRTVNWRESLPGEPEPHELGHSIGFWEGDTLVVETGGFLPHPEGNGRGIPSGTRKHVTERFTLEDDGNQMRVVAITQDPEYLAEAHTEEHLMQRVEETLIEYECDPVASSRYTSPD